jgi:hypothetical protein
MASIFILSGKDKKPSRCDVGDVVGIQLVVAIKPYRSTSCRLS